MQQQIEIRDIKPLLEIPDSSHYIYWGVIGFLALLVVAIVVFVVLKFWRLRKANNKKAYLAKLKGIDWSDAKRAAYEATEYGRVLVHDKATAEIYEQLVPKLEQYKYKKSVDDANDETLKLFKLFVQVCDESL